MEQKNNKKMEQKQACLQVRFLNSKARMPEKKSALAAGYDLFSTENVTIDPGCRKLVSTGLSIALPPHSYGRIAPRSGLSVKGIDVGAGVIDADYRGEIKVLLINHHDQDSCCVQVGDRIAQLIVEALVPVQLQVQHELSETERGENGFGSTGV